MYTCTQMSLENLFPILRNVVQFLKHSQTHALFLLWSKEQYSEILKHNNMNYYEKYPMKITYKKYPT